jgi:hypothetical protein
MRTFLGALLLVGLALLLVGAIYHPMLAGDNATQLRLIASTPYWRAIHLSMLTGSAFVMAGIWARELLVPQVLTLPVVAQASTVRGTTVPVLQSLETSAAPALVVLTIGLALNAYDIAVMASSAPHLAQAFISGDQSIPAIYEATHLVGVMTARFGNGVIALGAAMLSWTEWPIPGRRLPALLAAAAAAGGLLGVVAFDETSRGILAAVTLLSAWSLTTAIEALRRPAPSLH